LSLFVENIRQGFGSLKSHKVRASITASIIAIGITALVGILTSIDAMNNAISKTMSKMGSQSFNISNRTSVERFGVADDFDPITYEQAHQFEAFYGAELPVSLSLTASFNSKIKYQNQETNPNIKVLGVEEDYLKTANYEISAGRNFTPNDIRMNLPLAVVGYDIVKDLFLESDLEGCGLGKTISIDGKPFKIVGELKKKGSSMGMSGGDRLVFIPIHNARQSFASVINNCNISVLVDQVDHLESEMNEAYTIMRRIRRLRPSDSDDFAITKSDALAKDAQENMAMVSGVGTLIGIITLLGAAVSLMNIMLVSVTERTREIGLRKALGATSKNIRDQFLVEAIVICQIGGLGGIVLGLLLGNLVAMGLGSGFIAPWNWILMAFVVCILVGLLAGLYPARKASKLDPIEALRHD
jgi:putative ABC transport system permease protein